MVAVAHEASGSPSFGVSHAQHGSLAPTLLSSGATGIPVAGRIRAGIKVLTRKAEAVPIAKQIYQEGVERDLSFDAIEAQIVRAAPNLDNPLMPKNVPYFTVRGCDFPHPETAKAILDLYGEDRGDGVKRLYRFPVIFPADAWQRVMPHELVTWTSSERKFWSEYSSDGVTRYCKTHEAVPLDGPSRRVIRLWGGRKHVARPENDGVCDPESCKEYQSRQCNLTGRFIFFIPGIRSISAFDLPTNSFYAMRAAIEKFQTIAFMRGGRIGGFLDGKGTTFFISKRLTEVSRIDEFGKPTRVSQWLIELEAPVDVSSLLRPGDEPEAIEVRANEAVMVLEGASSVENGRSEKQWGPDAPTGESQVQSDGASAAGNQQSEHASVGKAQPDRKETPPATASQKPSHTAAADTQKSGKPGATRAAAARPMDGDQSAAADLAWILDAAKALGVPPERYEAYAAKRWGSGWKLNPSGRKQALKDISAFADDQNGFRKKVAAELDVFK